METKLLKPNEESIALACKLLKDGEIVGIGTLSTAYYGRTRYTQCVMNDYLIN